MDVERLRKQAEEASKLARAADAAYPGATLKRILDSASLSASFAASDALKKLVTAPLLDIIDRRSLFPSLSEAMYPKVLSTFADSLPSILAPEVTRAWPNLHQDLFQSVAATTQGFLGRSVLQSQLQLTDVLKSFTWAPADLPWLVVNEEAKGWPARLGLSALLAAPSLGWVADSTVAAAAWDIQAAVFADLMTTPVLKMPMDGWLQELKTAVQATATLADLGGSVVDVRLLLDVLPKGVPQAWREEALVALEGLTPDAADDSASALAVRQVVLGVLFLVLVATLTMPGGTFLPTATARALLGTADLIIDKAVELGVALDEVPLVRAASTGALGYSIVSGVNRSVRRRALAREADEVTRGGKGTV